MASSQDDSSLDLCHEHKREHSQDSGAYIDWNSEDSASPIGNSDKTINEDFITVVSVENGKKKDSKKDDVSFVTILAIGNSEKKDCKNFENDKEEEVLVYRLPGERLGFGLKFEGGTNTAENVKRLFIQSSAPDSPASRAKCSWGSLVEGDEILKIDSHVVKNMTRLDCVRCLKESSVVIKLFVRHKYKSQNEQGNQTKIENLSDSRVKNGSSPMVVSAEMKKTLPPPPPPPVPPRKGAKKTVVPISLEETVFNPPEGFDDLCNSDNFSPKAKNISVADDALKTTPKFTLRVPQKGNQESPDLSKRLGKRNNVDVKMIPAEPKVYLDLLSIEENRNGESESDDTGSTVSTVVGLSSISTTTNSSFSDLRSSASSFCDSTNPSTPTSEPTTPLLDVTKLLSVTDNGEPNNFLFSKLINGKDHERIISSNEKNSDVVIPLQPPLSFQDAPLSYGNEEMRTTLTENVNFFSEENSSNEEHDICGELDPTITDEKLKEKPSVLSKKNSLIPRLAKSIGLLSPPKPSPRKEPSSDGLKSKFNKKKPLPLITTKDNIVESLTENNNDLKSLKPSIPYLKKKKNKNDESKKASKLDKKHKNLIVENICKEKENVLPKETSSDGYTATEKESTALEKSDTDFHLMWEVPPLKNFKEEVIEEDKNFIQIYNENFDTVTTEPQDLFSNVESNNFNVVCDNNDTPFAFHWGGSKLLETIGEDEEDSTTEEIFKRNGIPDKNTENEISLEANKVENKDVLIVPEIENIERNNDIIRKTLENNVEQITGGKVQKDYNNSIDFIAGVDEKFNLSVKSEKLDDSETNEPDHQNNFCDNHVLVKLDNESLEVANNLDLSSSNDNLRKAMVPVESAKNGFASSLILNRMPPDGHEFPQKYTESETLGITELTSSETSDTALPPLPSSEPPVSPRKEPENFNVRSEFLSSGKLHAGNTIVNSLVTKPSRNSFWRQDEKSEKSVRDKIAMFSSVSESFDNSATCPSKLNKYKSSDDVFYYDEEDYYRNFSNKGKLFSKSALGLDRVNNPLIKKQLFSDSNTSSKSLDYTNRTQSSVDLSSLSSSAYSSSCSPDSSLSSNSSNLGYSSTLPRKYNRSEGKKNEGKQIEGLKREPTGIHRTTSFNLHGRSQSLLNINPNSYKARRLSECCEEDSQKPGSLNLLIEQRRKNLSKLRGLVIPEKPFETISAQPIVDLPEIRSRELILNSKMPNTKEKIMPNKWTKPIVKENSTAKNASAYLWDMHNNVPNIPKYSPAFKRKSISVFGSSNLNSITSPVQKVFQESLKAPTKPPRNIHQNQHGFIGDEGKYQDANAALSESEITCASQKRHNMLDIHRYTDTYPKRKQILLGKYRSHSEIMGRSEEDSDNDSAVSSSRSSISHGFSPPASPLLDNQLDDSMHRASLLSSPERNSVGRTLSSETTASAVSTNSTFTSGSQASISSNDASPTEGSNKRILKPQSVEAINRKNVLTSAKYSRGFDAKSGSPLIQRKFSENSNQNFKSDLELLNRKKQNFYSDLKYLNNYEDSNKKSCEKFQTNKISYMPDEFDNTEDSFVKFDKKKLEKSESLPLEAIEPRISQKMVARKTSMPSALSWETNKNWNQSIKEISDQESKTIKQLSSATASFSKIPEKEREHLNFIGNINKKSNGSLNNADENSSNELIIDNKKDFKTEPKIFQIPEEKFLKNNRRSTSVNDIRKAFEKIDSSSPKIKRVIKNGNMMISPNMYNNLNGNHVRVSSLDSTTSEDGGFFGFTTNLQREQFGSITSLASSTSLISPQELQLLIEEANQILEESGSNPGNSSLVNHDILVVILHRDTIGGSVGITLAGGADYESKEITVHKVLAGSPADRDGRIQKGDRILSINGKSMKGVTHRESLAILKSPRLEVVLVVSRVKPDTNIENNNSNNFPSYSDRHNALLSRSPKVIKEITAIDYEDSPASNIAREPPVTLTLTKDGAGLGFSLEGGKDCPTGDKALSIKKIFTGGAAEKCGQLQAGDELLEVNGIDVTVMSRIEAWKLMKQLPDGDVTITVKHKMTNKSAI